MSLLTHSVGQSKVQGESRLKKWGNIILSLDERSHKVTLQKNIDMGKETMENDSANILPYIDC